MDLLRKEETKTHIILLHQLDRNKFLVSKYEAVKENHYVKIYQKKHRQKKRALAEFRKVKSEVATSLFQV